MTLIHYLGSDGRPVPVSASNPLPGAGGGGGMSPEDITASAPATWDAETVSIGVTVGTSAGSVCAGNDARLSDAREPTSHTHAWADITDTPVAAHVGPETGTVADIVDALVAAGLMASS